MPEFRPAAAIEVESRGDGWTLSTLADERHVPGLAMVARQWRLEAGASGPEQTWLGPAERFLYVVSGGGWIHLASGALKLDREDMVWLEARDRYQLEAGDRVLEVLEATSAASPADPVID